MLSTGEFDDCRQDYLRFFFAVLVGMLVFFSILKLIVVVKKKVLIYVIYILHIYVYSVFCNMCVYLLSGCSTKEMEGLQQSGEKGGLLRIIWKTDSLGMCRHQMLVKV